MTPESLKELGDFELTTKEHQAFSRLQDNKDFTILTDVLARWMLKRGIELQSGPQEGQDFTLIRYQGGYDLFKRMLEYVFNSRNL